MAIAPLKLLLFWFCPEAAMRQTGITDQGTTALAHCQGLLLEPNRPKTHGITTRSRIENAGAHADVYGAST